MDDEEKYTIYTLGVEMFCDATGGLWGGPKEGLKFQRVRVTKLELHRMHGSGGPSDNIFELRVFFDKRTWNINRDGLLYTDEGFERDLRKGLRELGFSGTSKVDGSEAGMQGTTYFSGDVSHKFAKSFMQDPDVVTGRTVAA